MKTLRTTLLLSIASLVALLGASFVAATPSSAATAPVEIKDYSYSPADLTLHVGDTGTWTNHDSAPHTVTSSDGGPLDSPTLHTGDSWSFTFTQPGTYAYYCAIHPDMVGKVTVTGSSEPSPPPSMTPPPSGGGGDGGGMAMPPPSSPPGSPSSPPAKPSCPSNGTADAIVEPFWMHFKSAHLETSPGDQAASAADADQYTKTHTVLFEQMLTPVVDLALAAPDGVDPFWMHFKTAHLETSPGDQAASALNVDQYTKTHTVLIENMAAPSMDQVAGGC